MTFGVGNTVEVHDYTDNGWEKTGEVSLSGIEKWLKPGHVAHILDGWLNSYENPLHRGIQVGRLLHETHRSLQAMEVSFAVGLLAGLSEETTIDPRNRAAIDFAKKVKALAEKEGFILVPY